MAGPVQLQKCAKPGVFFIIYDRDTGIPDNNLTLFFLVSEKVVDEIDKDAAVGYDYRIAALRIPEYPFNRRPAARGRTACFLLPSALPRQDSSPTACNHPDTFLQSPSRYSPPTVRNPLP